MNKITETRLLQRSARSIGWKFWCYHLRFYIWQITPILLPRSSEKLSILRDVYSWSGIRSRLNENSTCRAGNRTKGYTIDKSVFPSGLTLRKIFRLRIFYAMTARTLTDIRFLKKIHQHWHSKIFLGCRQTFKEVSILEFGIWRCVLFFETLFQLNVSYNMHYFHKLLTNEITLGLAAMQA